MDKLTRARLPKSARHWVERAGFTLQFTENWRDWGIYARSTKADYITGCTDPVRHIRILPHADRFEICDGFFDRWANSVGAWLPMPKSELAFKSGLKILLATVELHEGRAALESGQ